MILADDRDPVLGAVIGQHPAGLGDRPSRPSGCSDPPVLTRIAVAAEAAAASTHFLWFSTALFRSSAVGVAQVSLAVDHDQDAGDLLIVGPLLEVLQVGRILALSLKN